jgi:hypothetical protein
MELTYQEVYHMNPVQGGCVRGAHRPGVRRQLHPQLCAD